MEEKKLNSLVINGIGNYGGGEFERVNISGKGKITGEITCDSFDISGFATFEENVISSRGHVSGNCKAEKDMTVEEIAISGMYKQEGSMAAERFEVSGVAQVKQCLNATKLFSTGMLSVGSDMNGEEIRSEGIINCDGFINCEKLEIICAGGCKLNEVGAASITVKEQSVSVSKLISLFIPNLTLLSANVIEGDDIYLECCDVKVVRGKNTKLGRNCKIDTIEYSDSFQKDEASTVENLIKTAE